MAAYYPEKPSTEQMKTMRDFWFTFSKLYPCSYCASHLQVELNKSPPVVNSNRSLNLWLCGLHNEVNERLGKPKFDCSKRELGQGAYGVVCAAKSLETGQEVAIKKVQKVFEKSILAKRALREIKLLRHFNGHENITGLLDMDIADPVQFNEIYLVQELMEADLHQIIRSGQPLTDAHFQYFMYQICRGLKFIHSANVLHRDLKPGNLLVNADCELKSNDAGFMTEYVATRWYRAPEIMLSFKNYTKATLDLLEKLLTFDPAARITVEEALSHPYLEAYHDAEDEPVHDKKFDFSFESVEAIEDMKRMIAGEVAEYKAQKAAAQQLANNLPRPRETLPGPSRADIGHVPRDVDEYATGAMDVDEELRMREGGAN
ncbi:Mitogen-activated protein kinase [Phlyctochytrium bullatum]|nr:Mitogen-activated protein kinase [Phlyctochytrium bullatum]